MLTHFDDKGKIFTQVISKKPVSVIIQTATHQIKGLVYIRPDDRLKNTLDNNTEAYLAVTDATVFSQSGESVYTTGFLAVNRSHIVWILPEEDLNRLSNEEEKAS